MPAMGMTVTNVLWGFFWGGGGVWRRPALPVLADKTKVSQEPYVLTLAQSVLFLRMGSARLFG